MKIFLTFGVIIIVTLIFGFFVLSGKTTESSNAAEVTSIGPFSHLTPKQFSQEVTTGKYTLIDVRTMDEFNAGHIKNAKQADYYETQKFSDYLDKLDKKASYLIYCRSGHRSGEALKIMQSKGFHSANDIAGGYNAWIADGLPIEK